MDAFKRAALITLAILLAVTLSAGGVILYRGLDDGSGSRGVEVRLPAPTTQPTLKVYVSGEVAAPGVYVADPGDRVEDAVAAAGGPLQGAQLSCINLAARVRDGDQYHVPSTDDDCKPGISEPAAADLPEVAQQGQEGKIDLNSASAQELQALPGIGEVKANAIVTYRNQVGPFSSVEEVVEVHGIGPATLNAIADLVYAGRVSE